MVYKVSMVKWKLIKNDNQEFYWDNELNNFSDSNFYQSESWAKHKLNFNWKVYRFVAYNGDNKIISMAQCLVRIYPFNCCIISCPGGPVGDLSKVDGVLIRECIEVIGKKYIYLRIRSPRENSVNIINNLSLKGWRTPKNKLTTNLTLLLNLEQEEEALKKNLSKNWHRNLKRYKHDLLSITRWPNPDIDKIISLYAQMESYKGIKKSYSNDELISLIQNFNEQIILFRCEINGELVGIRAAIIKDKKAWDFLAATNPIGRKYYASHQLFWTLLMECKAQGVKYYDFSGVDPEKNPGVYNFKRGTGATQIEYIGELEWTNSNLFRYFANIAIKYKMDTS